LRSPPQEEEDVFDNGDEEAVGGVFSQNRQYPLEVTRRNKKQQKRLPQQKLNIFRRIITLNGCIPLPDKRVSFTDGVHPNQTIAMYLHWMFRVNFFFLFVVMCVAFFALVIFFAGLITLAGTLDAECVRVGSGSFASAGAPFADAFALSWTTISTVRRINSRLRYECSLILYADSIHPSSWLSRWVCNCDEI
jgi:hypothetical protein